LHRLYNDVITRV